MEQEKNTLSVLQIAPGQHPKLIEIDNNTDQYEKLMWGFSYISFCLSKHFWKSDVFVSFLLTASL